MLMCICGAISFGLLATASKFAERNRCNASALTVSVFAWAALFMLAQTFRLVGHVQTTWPVATLAVGLGVCAAVAYFAFQTSIDVGNVTVGWLMMNLSAGVPALVSLWLYGEKMSLMRSIAFVLALVSLLCLFQGNRLEAKGKSRGEA